MSPGHLPAAPASAPIACDTSAEMAKWLQSSGSISATTGYPDLEAVESEPGTMPRAWRAPTTDMTDGKNMDMPLSLKQNIDDFEAFYSMLDESHAGLDPDGSKMLNSQLVLLLSNQIGDMAVLRQVFAIARVKVEMIQKNKN